MLFILFYVSNIKSYSGSINIPNQTILRNNPIILKIMSAPLTVQVISPALLEEGCTFPAQVDEMEFTVTVPAGGIEKDGVFSVPYPTALDTTTTTNIYNFRDSANKDDIGLAEAQLVPAYEAAVVSTNKNVDFHHVPTGQWRTELCDCMCIMAYCCPIVLFSQVMQRMKFDYCGKPAAMGRSKPVCQVFTLITFGGLLLLLFAIPLFSNNVTMSAVLPILARAWGIYLTVVFTCTRMSMRRKYNIQPAFTDCCIEDCCMIYCCAPCSAIQLANHTHNRMEPKYKYNACSQTGLYGGTSEVV